MVAACVSCGVRRGDDVLMRSGFEGWVVIRYDVKGSPQLKEDGFRNVIRVPASGELSTSSSRATGYAQDAYYLENTGGKRERIPGWSEDCQLNQICVQEFQLFSSPSISTIFFVGHKSDMTKYPRPSLEKQPVQ
jgi:hypothetical protein